MRRQSIFELGHSSARLIAQKANSQRSTSSHAQPHFAVTKGRVNCRVWVPRKVHQHFFVRQAV